MVPPGPPEPRVCGPVGSEGTPSYLQQTLRTTRRSVKKRDYRPCCMTEAVLQARAGVLVGPLAAILVGFRVTTPQAHCLSSANMPRATILTRNYMSAHETLRAAPRASCVAARSISTA